MNVVFIACFSIALSVAAQFALKAGTAAPLVQMAMREPYQLDSLIAVLSRPEILLGFALYGLGALVWLYVLSNWDVSKAYPLVGLGFIGTVVIGALVGEQVTSARLVGVILISFGILLVARS